jgi:hypothetical protein
VAAGHGLQWPVPGGLSWLEAPDGARGGRLSWLGAPDGARGGRPATTPGASLHDPATLHEARFYRHFEDRRVQCQVCFRTCIVARGVSEFCRNKVNIDGSYPVLVYGRISAL